MLEARANLGVQLQSTSFQQELTVKEIIALYAGLYGIQLTDKDIHQKLVGIGLDQDANKRAGQLSGGQQQRLSLSVSTLHNPPLVLLDEPTTGLDPQSRRALWDTIDEMRKSGRSVLITTHSMEEAHAIFEAESHASIDLLVDIHQVWANNPLGRDAHNTSCVYFTAEVSLFVEINTAISDRCRVRTR